jgi:hypothetical protein
MYGGDRSGSSLTTGSRGASASWSDFLDCEDMAMVGVMLGHMKVGTLDAEGAKVGVRDGVIMKV